jgi:hypothetical protein
MNRKFIIAASILGFFSLQTLCQIEQLVINIAPESLPGMLTFENPKGSIKVTGYDGNVLVVNGTLRFNSKDSNADNGLRRIGQNVLDISAEVNGNGIILFCGTTGKTVDFDIKMPRNYSIKIKSLDNGIVDIVNINGEIEVENNNGDISLENISGSAVLSSVYGKISAVFREVKPESPMMFTSFEGDISITLPESINAQLKMKSENGEILSDFDIKPLSRQPVIKKVDNAQIYSLDDWVIGLINAGGPEYIIRTYNGRILIRKK